MDNKDKIKELEKQIMDNKDKIKELEKQVEELKNELNSFKIEKLNNEILRLNSMRTITSLGIYRY